MTEEQQQIQHQSQAAGQGQEEKSDNKVYGYSADWEIYAISFSNRAEYPIRLGIGSFIESEDNKVEVIQLSKDRTLFERKLCFDHTYPPSKIMWLPDENNTHPDLLVTSSDTLKVWEIKDNSKVDLKYSLKNQQKELSAPLTSFDWNQKRLEIICTSSIDTTCTIWDINKATSVKQLIAHDKEVFDVSFSPDSNIFATVGADGSARQFDTRDLTKSDILYETGEPLLRVAWNKNNQHYIAIIEMKQNYVTLVDTRKPFLPACKLYYHKEPVNYLTWAPHSPNHICTVSDDKQALIWDLGEINPEITAPLLEYNAEAEITNVSWSALQTDWVGLCFNRQLQILRVY